MYTDALDFEFYNAVILHHKTWRPFPISVPVPVFHVFQLPDQCSVYWKFQSVCSTHYVPMYWWVACRYICAKTARKLLHACLTHCKPWKLDRGTTWTCQTPTPLIWDGGWLGSIWHKIFSCQILHPIWIFPRAASADGRRRTPTKGTLTGTLTEKDVWRSWATDTACYVLYLKFMVYTCTWFNPVSTANLCRTIRYRVGWGQQ